jgi:hypothetical protein
VHQVAVHGGEKFQVGDHNNQYNISAQQIVLLVQDGTMVRKVIASGALEQPGRLLFDLGLGQARALDRSGVEAGIATPVLPAPSGAAAVADHGSGSERDAVNAGSGVGWSALQNGTAPVPIGGLRAAPAAGASAAGGSLAENFSRVAAQLGRVDGEVSGTVVGVEAGSDRVDLVELHVRQGTHGLWRFRRASARLFGEQLTACFRATLDWPAPPQIEMLNRRASGDLEVLRGVVLVNLIGNGIADQPWLVDQVVDQLGRGRWEDVLQDLEARAVLDGESALMVRTQIEAVGHPFDAAEATAAARDAQQAFERALDLAPQDTAALVNLATLLAESALFDYVAYGRRDRDRLVRARDLFARGHELIARRTDAAARGELARCRLYAAMMLPPDAVLESVQLTAVFADLMRLALARAAQQSIRWDVVQRNMARAHADFVDERGVAEARELFTAAGEAALAQGCDRMLAAMAQARMTRQAKAQWAQLARPVVGNWGFRGRNLVAAVSGTIVFDAEGHFHSRIEAGPMPGVAQYREVSVGEYAVDGMSVRMQGLRWVLLPAPWPAATFGGVLVVQSVGPEQLQLFNPADGTQVQCWRL